MTTAVFELLERELDWVETNIDTAKPAHVHARLLRAINFYNSSVANTAEQMTIRHLNKKVIRALLQILLFNQKLASPSSPLPVVQVATVESFLRQSAREAKPPKKRVVFSGSRNFTDQGLVERVLCTLDPKTTLIVHGACRTGLDAIVDTLAKAAYFRVKAVPANWIRHRAQAGPMRNRKMLDDWEPSCVYVFYTDPDNKSSGTNHCAIEALKRGIPVIQAHKMFKK
jgi:hypothetical protein